MPVLHRTLPLPSLYPNPVIRPVNNAAIGKDVRTCYNGSNRLLRHYADEPADQFGFNG